MKIGNKHIGIFVQWDLDGDKRRTLWAVMWLAIGRRLFYGYPAIRMPKWVR